MTESKIEKYKLLELYPDATVLIDPETALPVNYNSVAYKQLGYEPGEFARLRISDYDDRESPEDVEKHIKYILKHGRDDFETRHRRKDGTVIDVYVTVMAVENEGKSYFLCVFRNITESNKMMQALEKSEQRFRDVAEASGEYIWEIDPEGVYSFLTPRVEAVLGYSVKDILGNSPFDYMPEDESERVKNLLAGWAEKGEAWQNLEHKSIRSDGRIVWQRVSGIPLKNSGGEFAGFRGTGLDITIEIEARQAQNELTERLSLATEAAELGIWDLYLHEDRLEWDEGMFRIYGKSRQEFNHSVQNWIDALLPESRKQAEQDFMKGIESGESYESEFKIRRGNGDIRHIRAMAKSVHDEQGRPVRVVGVNEDVTDRKKAEEALKAERDYSDLIIRESPAIICSINSEGICNSVNPAGERITGYSAEELIGKNWWTTLYTGKEYEKVGQLLRDLKKGQLRDYEMTLLRKDGYRRIIEWSSFSRLDREDNLLEIVGFGRDITESVDLQTRLAREKDYLQLIIDSSPNLIFAKDWYGRFTLANISLAELFGTGREDMLGKTDYDMTATKEEVEAFLRDDREVMWSGRQKFIPREPLTDNQGSVRWFQTTKVPLFLSEPPEKRQVMGVATDITGLLESEHRVQIAREEAETANRAKSDFLANMSHEIRTPMNAIVGLSQLLQKTGLDDQQRDYLNKISNSSRMLLGIINDILDYSKIEAGKLEIDTHAFRMDELIDQMRTFHDPAASDKGLELFFRISPDVPRVLVGDSLRLGQVFSNLLGNAVKFTEKGGIELIVAGEQQKHQTAESGNGFPDSRSRIPENGAISRIRFEVRDTGIGMNRDQVNRLFQPFSQADTSTTRKYGGTGLGLAISHKLVEQMGGSLGVESVPEKGSSFFFSLDFPVIRQEDCSAASAVCDIDLETEEELPVQKRNLNSTLIPSFRGYSILLAEDNTLNQDVARQMLENTGAVVAVAGNGAEAVEMIKSGSFDIVLMDLQMPVMDGFEAASGILELYPELPIIALSAAVMDDDRMRSAQAGMKAHLDKPIDSVELYNTLSDWLKPGDKPVELKIDDKKEASFLSEFIEGFDLQEGLKSADGDRAFYFIMLHRFRDQLDSEFSLLYDKLKQKEEEKIPGLVHALKGSAGTVGAVDIAVIARKIDQEIKETGKADKKMLEELADALEKARTRLKKLPSIPGESREFDSEEGVSAMTYLLQLLERNELVDYSTLSTVTGFLKNKIGGEKPDELKRLVDNFENDAAVSMLLEAAAETGVELK